MTEPEQQSLERGALSFAEVLITGLSQIAPAFGVMFTAAAIAAGIGESVPLVYIIAMVGVGATGITLAQFARIWPSSGSFVTYVSRAIGPRVGVAVAVIALLGYTIGNGGVYLYVGSYFVSEVLHSSGTGLTLLVTAIYAVIVTVPVVIGVKIGVRAAILLYVIEVGVIAVFTAAILIQGGDHGLTAAPFHTGFTSTKGLALVLALGILAFVGFEAPAALGEESENPRRTVPLAILTGVLFTGLLYVVSSYAVVMAFSGPTALGSDPAPFVTAAHRFASPLTHVVTWLFLTSVTGSFLGANTALARIVYSGAREGLWTRRLDRVHPTFHTPWIAVIVVVSSSAAIGIGSTAFTSIGTATGFIPAFGILGIATMFIATNLALIVHWARERARGVHHSIWTWVVSPIVGCAVLVLPYYSAFQPGQASPYSWIPYMFVGLLVIGVLYTLVLERVRPDLMAQAGSVIGGERTTERPALAEG